MPTSANVSGLLSGRSGCHQKMNGAPLERSWVRACSVYVSLDVGIDDIWDCGIEKGTAASAAMIVECKRRACH
eukprot:4241702-Amphidinium_carterae.1